MPRIPPRHPVIHPSQRHNDALSGASDTDAAHDVPLRYTDSCHTTHRRCQRLRGCVSHQRVRYTGSHIRTLFPHQCLRYTDALAELEARLRAYPATHSHQRAFRRVYQHMTGIRADLETYHPAVFMQETP
jgi:hypothetical protein